MYKALDHSFEMSWGEMALGIIDGMKGSEIGKKFPKLGTILNAVRRKVLNVGEDHKIDVLLLEVQQFTGEVVDGVRLSSDEQARLDAAELAKEVAEVRRKLIFLEDYFAFQVENFEEKLGTGGKFALGKVDDFHNLHPQYRKASLNFRKSMKRDFGYEYDELAEPMGLPVVTDMSNGLGLRLHTSFELWRIYNKINGLPLANRTYKEGTRLPLRDDTVYPEHHYNIAYGDYKTALQKVIIEGVKVEGFTQEDIEKREFVENEKRLTSIKRLLLKHFPEDELPRDDILTSFGIKALNDRIAVLVDLGVPVTTIIFDTERFRAEFGSKTREKEIQLDEEAKVKLRKLGHPYEDMPKNVTDAYTASNVLEKVELIVGLGGKVATKLLRMNVAKIRDEVEKHVSGKSEKESSQRQLAEFIEARQLAPMPPSIRDSVLASSALKIIAQIEERGIPFVAEYWYWLKQTEPERNRLIQMAWMAMTKDERRSELAALYGFDVDSGSKAMEPDRLRDYAKVAQKLGHSLNDYLSLISNTDVVGFMRSLTFRLKRKQKALTGRACRRPKSGLTVAESEWLGRMKLVDSLRQRGFVNYKNIELEILIEEAMPEERDQMKNGGAMAALRAVAYRVEKRRRLETLLRKHRFDYSDMDYFGESLDRIEVVIDGIEELERLKIPVTREILYSMDFFVARAVDLDKDDTLTPQQRDIVAYLQNVGCDILWARRLAKGEESLAELRAKVVHLQEFELDPVEFGKSHFDVKDFQEILDKPLSSIKIHGVRILRTKLREVAAKPKVTPKIDRIFLEKLKAVDLLNHQQEMKLAEFKDQGIAEAVDILVQKNIGLVTMFAKRYLWSCIALNELVQEGNKGLVKAIQKFEWRRGYRLSTYAGWWIRQSIGRFVVKNAKNVRLTFEMDNQVRRYNQVVVKFSAEKFRDPSDDELVKLLGIDVQDLEMVKAAVAVRKRSEVSFDAPISNDGSKSATKLEMTGSDSPLHRQSEIRVDRDILFRRLHPFIVDYFGEERASRAFDIFASFYGFRDDTEMTLEALGKKYGITRSRVGQIADDVVKLVEAQPEVMAMLVEAAN